GSLVPCFQRGWFAACAVLSGGVLRASATGVEDAQRVTLPYFAAGARLAADIMLGSLFFLRPHLEAMVVLTRPLLSIGQTEVWVGSPISGDAGLSAGVVFQ